MGCSTSKSKDLPSKSGPGSRHHRSDMDSDTVESRAQKAAERAMKKKINETNQAYRRASLPELERRTSQETFEQDTEDAAAIRIQNFAKRKAAKAEAVKSQKWMIYSNMDIYDDADMVELAKFMKTVIHKVPDLVQPIIHDKALRELEVKVADEDIGSDTTKDGNSGNTNTEDVFISITRENSNTSNISNLPIFTSNISKCDSATSLPSDSNDDTIKIERDNSNASICSVGSVGSVSSNSSTVSSIGIAVSRGDSLSNILSHSFLQVENNRRDMNKFNDPIDDDEEDNDNAILKAVRIDTPSKKITEFTLPSGPITPRVAKKIINVYKGGGRLCTDAVHKILRLSYRSLKELPNIYDVSLNSKASVTVVGDLHGQLLDLLHILDKSGFPNDDNMYIFNGDFVDRGAFGVEVMVILLALHAAMPNRVLLNRGNHEDFIVCSTYGFQSEVFEKYDDITFGMFVEIFTHLPLFAIINKEVFIVHGGLFRCLDITITDLARISRVDYSLANMPDDETLDCYPRYRQSDFSNQVIRDALWSDPHETLQGLGASTRGAGVSFGADVTEAFLKRNNLKMVIRSHECTRDGYSEPYTGEKSNILCTIFSASNYMFNNSGAYMVFKTDTLKNNAFIHASSHGNAFDRNDKHYISDSFLYYTVHFFNIDENVARFDESILYAAPSYEDDLGLTLYELVLRQKPILLEEFVKLDVGCTGLISKATWAEAMKNVIKLHIRWLTMVDMMVNPIALEDIGGISMIRYRTFLDNFTATLEPDYHHGINESGDSNIFVEAFYSQHKKLEAVFRFFDKDCDGIISSDEFKTGCQILNDTLPDDQRLTNIDRILGLLDTDESGCIDVNEFFEMFRLSEGANLLMDNLSPPNVRQGRSSSQLPSFPSLQNISDTLDNNIEPIKRASMSYQHIPSLESPLSASQHGSSVSGRRRQLSGQFSPVSRQESSRTSLEVKGIVINIEGESDIVDITRQVESTSAVDI